MSKSYQIIIIVIIYLSQVNSTPISKHSRIDEASDELVSLDDYSEEEVLNKGRDENKNGGTLIIDGVNSFIFLPNDESISDNVQPCHPGHPGCAQQLIRTMIRSTILIRRTTPRPRRPINSVRPTKPFLTKPRPTITAKPASSEKLGASNCGTNGFLGFLGIMPAGCQPLSGDSFSQLAGFSDLLGTCSDPKKNQSRKASARESISSKSSKSLRPTELPVYPERKNNLWNDYDGLEAKGKAGRETTWNMENFLSPRINHEVDVNLLRKMYNEHLNDKNTAKYR
ncbi:uncharacterized protein LOC117175315 [Belonocnema kinseyi]|uniref:uncharacterized protein LOC117175315 n=1 Tax=Belonocnema kinseyi TaxID=2817044 RepID=UPI00143D6B0B|nr:uncharacterized protein LOC117175315 [Belonocnema kinseyi]